MKYFTSSFLSYSIFFLFISSLVFAQPKNESAPSAKIEHYSLHLSIDDVHHSFSAEAEMRIRFLKDSISALHFSFNKILDFDSARDSTGAKFSQRVTKLGDGTSDVVVSLPNSPHRGDSLFLRLLYDAEIDSLLTASAFITEGNILLPSTCGALWWPVLSPQMNSTEQNVDADFTVVVPNSYIVVSGGLCDTVHLSSDNSEWRFHHTHELPIKSAFFLCASKDFVEKSFVSADSFTHLSFYFIPQQFNGELAKYLTQQIGTAAEYFSTLTMTKPPQLSCLRFVVFGNETSGENESGSPLFSRTDSFNDGTFIVPNSPAFSVFDSSSLLLSAENMWVKKLTRLFCVATTDSSYWLNEGWRSYLSARFFLDAVDTLAIQREHERLRLMAGALDFYPTYSLSSGRHRENETAVFSRKGAYVFLMLEYLLGKELFDDVIRTMYTNYSTAPITITEFQKLCENAYGTPLDWFFDEWVYRSGFPEFIFSLDTVQTVRGSYDLNVRVFQRGDVYTMPLDLVIATSARTITKRIFLQRQYQTFQFIVSEKPLKVELDPEYKVLRWIPRLRLVAHARTSESYRVFDHDLVNSEKEALLTLQLDPNNLTGSNPLALFSLGKIAVLRGDLVKAESYFYQASQMESVEPARYIPLLSVVRLGNVLEMEGKREEALQLYQQVLNAAAQSPSGEAVAIVEAKKYLQEKFVSSEEFWYGKY